MSNSNKVRVDFICLHNAGRSQMAAAFAERERSERELESVVEIHSGGTDPADSIHDTVVRVMSEVGIDLSGRTPGYVANLDQLKESHYLITMGCSISKFNPSKYGVESHSWDLTDPEEKDIETVREVREDIETRVRRLFDDIEAVLKEERTRKKSSGGVITSIRDVMSF